MIEVLKYTNILGHTVILFIYTVASVFVIKDLSKGRIYWAILVVVVANILERLAAGLFVQVVLEPGISDAILIASLF